MRTGATIRAGKRSQERKERSMARKRYQRGSLKLEGGFWVARWREDVVVNGQVIRKPRKKQLCSLAEFQSKKLAQREFDRLILNAINAVDYKPVHACTFTEFAKTWEETVMSQFKPSSKSSSGSVMQHLLPFFGAMPLKDIGGEDVQRFISEWELSGKYLKNVIADFKLIWKCAKCWGYVSHNPVEFVRLPKIQKNQRPAYTAEECYAIITAADEPYKTMYWIAAEAGIRAGEICGLAVRDLNFDLQKLFVVQSSWRGELQTPKSGNSIRRFNMSPELCEHLKTVIAGKSPSDLVFSKDGKPYQQDHILDKLDQLLMELRIAVTVSIVNGKEVVKKKKGYGLHSFRHFNATTMDQHNAPAAVRLARIGHGDLSTFLGYDHLVSADDVRIAQALHDSIFKRPTVQ